MLHQIDRGKPKLRVQAVPSYNLPADDLRDLKRKHEASETHRKIKKQHSIGNDIPKATLPDDGTKTRRPIIKRLLKDFSKKRTKENASVHNSYNDLSENIDEGTTLDDLNSTSEDHIDEHSNIVIQEASYEMPHGVTEEEDEESSYHIRNNDRTDLQTDELTYDCGDAGLFDGIYEDIYEVTLPNTLWGVHRDPNRTFIVFSYFDGKTCSTSKLIHLDSSMNVHIYIRGKMVNKYLCSLSIEYLTSLVSQVDEYRICENFDVNSRCEVVAVDRLCTICQCQ